MSTVVSPQGANYSHIGISGHARVHLGAVYNYGIESAAEPESTASFKVPLQKASAYIAPNFVARPPEMEKICTFLEPGTLLKEQRTFVIHGLGGSGKTQLMLQFAITHQNNYEAIAFLDGSSDVKLKESFVVLARQIRAKKVSALLQSYIDATSESLHETARSNTDTKLENLIRGILDWFSLIENKYWLLLFDNVDREWDPNDIESYDIRRYFPTSYHGSIIITTRYQPYCRLGKQSLTLFQVTPEQGLQLLLNVSERDASDGTEQAAQLVQRLGCLPLALVQAGSYIREARSNFQEYLEFYNTAWDELMRDDEQRGDMADISHGYVGTTWSVTYQFLKRKDPMAATMLQLLAFFDRTGISHQTFKAVSTQTTVTWKDPPEIVKQLYSKIAYNRIVRCLATYALIQQRAATESLEFDIHPVVQDWCLYSIAHDDREELSVLAFRIIGSCLSAVDRSNPTDPTVQLEHTFRPHISRCLEFLDNDVESKMVLYSEGLCQHLFYCGKTLLNYHNTAAINLLTRANVGFERLHGSVNYYTTASDRFLAIAFIYTDQIEMAEQTIIKTLPSDMAVNRDTIDFLPILATAYGKQDKHELAEKTFQKILMEFEPFVQDEESRRAFMRAQVRFFTFYMELKKYEEAIRVLTPTLQDSTIFHTLSKETKFALVYQLCLAHEKKGTLNELIPWLEPFSQEWQALFGAGNVNARFLSIMLAEAYAESYNWEKVVAIRRKLAYDSQYQFEALERLVQCHLLGGALRQQGQLEEAESVLHLTLKQRKELLGSDHLDTIHTYYEICLLLENRKRFQEATKLCQQQINERKAKCSKDAAAQPDSMKPYNADEDSMLLSYQAGLGSFLRQDGKLEEAESILRATLANRQRITPPDELEVLNCERLLAFTCKDQNKHQEAESLFWKVFQGRRDILGREHASTVDASLWYAEMLLSGSSDRDSEAEVLLMEDHFIRGKKKMPKDANYAVNLFYLAQLHLMKNNFAGARPFLKDCLAIKEEINSPNSSDTLTILFWYARCCFESKEVGEARECFKRFIDNANDDMSLCEIYTDALYFQGLIYNSLSQYEEAMASFQECLSLRSAQHAASHTPTLMVSYQIALLKKQLGALEEAAQMIEILIDELLVSTPPLAAPGVKEILDIQGQLYRQLGEIEKAEKPYSRVVAAYFFEGLFPEVAINSCGSSLELSQLSIYLSTLIDRVLNEEDPASLTMSSLHPNMGGYYCDGCIHRQSLQSRMTGDFFLCRICEDVGFCHPCFKDLQEGEAFPLCSKSHDFVEVFKDAWRVDLATLTLVNDNGQSSEAWVKEWMAAFLQQMWEKDAKWMIWATKTLAP